MSAPRGMHLRCLYVIAVIRGGRYLTSFNSSVGLLLYYFIYFLAEVYRGTLYLPWLEFILFQNEDCGA